MIPAAASSSFPSQEKTLCFHCRHTPSSWAGGNAPGHAAGSAARASPRPPVPSHDGQARCQEQRSKECIPAGLPALAAPCLPRASSRAQTLSQRGMAGCGQQRVPHRHPSDKRPRHPTSVTHPWLPSPSQLLCPRFISCHPVQDPGLARDSQAGAGDTLPCVLTACNIALQVPEATAQGALVRQRPWHCHGSAQPRA